MKQPTKTLLAEYFLGFATREVSGAARPWRLYYESDADAGIRPARCDAAFSGDLYINGDIKDIASSCYPAIGPYDLTDPVVAEYHVLLAKAAGIDGFMAEYTLGQEKQLLTLARAAHRYHFRVGVTWITQSHLGENTWRDRAEAIDKARELVKWMAREVYLPCGVEVDGKFLLLIFLAHPRNPTQPFDPFFSPAEVDELKDVALQAGMDANFVVLPWEELPELPEGATRGPRIWDGYFPWIWFSGSVAAQAGECWTHVMPREQYLARLRAYYTMAARVRREGRINLYLGGVTPGFDDHKGQAWGEGHKRYLPREGGATLRDTWQELKQTDADAALIITWNDWVENSQIEPSLEIGDADLRECARQAAQWKQTPLDESLLGLPIRLLHARRAAHQCLRAGVNTHVHDSLLDRAADAIAALDANEAQRLLALGEAAVARMTEQLSVIPVHCVWEYGFDSAGISTAEPRPLETVSAGGFSGAAFGQNSALGFAVTDDLRNSLHHGYFVGKLCFEYLDTGVDFVQVRVDAADESRQTIASFKKTDTGRWLKASLDLVNARFHRGLAEGADIRVEQRAGTSGAVRMIRVDGGVYRA